MIRLALALLLVALSLGFSYQLVARARDLRRNPAPGQMVDIGGYRLHIHCTGHGSPTVILEAGGANGSLSWYQVQPLIARFTRVCAYDRAGHGWSDSIPKSRLPSEIAEELHGLLARARIDGPYVFVGHSIGGFYAWIFAARFRNQVAGVVLVDSSHPDQYQRLPKGMQVLERDGQRKINERIIEAYFGLPRFFGWEYCGGGPPKIKDALRATECGPQFYRTIRDEFGGATNSWEFQDAARQFRSVGPISDMPLTVIAQDPNKPNPGLPADLDASFRQVHLELERDLLHLSQRSTFVIATNSGHMIPFERPDLIAECVHRMTSSKIAPE